MTRESVGPQPHLPQDGCYNRIEFRYDRLVDGRWELAKLLILPLWVETNLVFGGGEMMCGYNFDQDAVNGLTGDPDLDGLAAEQAFVLPNEAFFDMATLLADDPQDESDWLFERRIIWRLYAETENCDADHDHAVCGRG